MKTNEDVINEIEPLIQKLGGVRADDVQPLLNLIRAFNGLVEDNKKLLILREALGSRISEINELLQESFISIK